MKNYYITTGFMGSGSSAMTNLLCEFEGVEAPNSDFEYVFLHAPNGLFDLEDKLLIGNNALRSDEAIHSFYDYMNDLYYKKHYWVSDYKNKVSKSFMEYVDEFIYSLNPIKLKGKNAFWYYTENPDWIMMMKKVFRKMIALLTFNRIVIQQPLKYQGMILAYPTSEEFYGAAKKFVYQIMEEIKSDKQTIVLDQFLLPHNLQRLDSYFSDDVIVVLVDRDPRDIYLSNKYYWISKNISIPVPTDVKGFCYQYRRMRESICNTNKNKVVRVQFEDLIYDYENTLKRIYRDLNLSTELHIDKGKYFNPKVSIVNTNLQRKSTAFIREAESIAEELSDYLYRFPEDYQYNDKLEEVF